ncbi:epoxide hydrolase [Stigmatella sp. ncwal1]|uniref:Epoxide hydrolase n=1 Tax=Stigmatella ashevillensis TaxID=2995309 RepID=A0ABT5D5R4_9BACT|nr:epoxide hydrolase [Stigmatella ashevillena]MDC0707581.1 epoxide hydrolase [Stigmatella ashevillena]
MTKTVAEQPGEGAAPVPPPPSRRALLHGAALAAGAALVKPGIASAAPAGVSLPPATPGITPFKIAVPQSALTDLKRRLGSTRWPERETVDDWSQGVPLAKLQALVEYWRTRYDWRRAEATLNRFPNYRTQLDGLGIHFIHARSKHENALPILLTHGWPGSVIEFLKLIPLLTDPTAHGGTPEDAFHVILPSLPGFGFSDKPTQKGWNMARIAKAWAELMQRLGYTHWVAQGGDWGAGVTTALAHLKAAGLAGIHLNFPLVFPEKIPTDNLTPEEQRALAGAQEFNTHGSGYFLLQTTRPQTVGYALADSPSGQAAWIYEKFQGWTDNKGDPESALSRDEMLDNISLYWLTDTAASSARIYWENAGSNFSGGKLDLPVGVSVFPRELFRAPKRWAEQTYSKLIYWNEPDRGGHFAAFEQPALFARELRECFRQLRAK